MEIITKPIEEIHEYENNPRNNDMAVQYVVESIRNFGFRVPILIDRYNVIVAGHTRVKAARQLGISNVPCIVADDLSDEQVRAFRIIDNKVAEMSDWDLDKLDAELSDLDFDWEDFGFPDDDDSELYEDIPELAKTYTEPEVAKLQCPRCGHVDSKVRFKKV